MRRGRAGLCDRGRNKVLLVHLADNCQHARRQLRKLKVAGESRKGCARRQGCIETGSQCLCIYWLLSVPRCILGCLSLWGVKGSVVYLELRALHALDDLCWHRL